MEENPKLRTWYRILNRIKTQQFCGNSSYIKPTPGVIPFDKRKWADVSERIDCRINAPGKVDEFMEELKIAKNDWDFVDVSELAKKIGFNINPVSFDNEETAGRLEVDKGVKTIFISSDYQDDYEKMVFTISYFLGYYNILKKEGNKKMLYEISKDELYSSKEGDPELYYFAKQLLKRDMFVGDDFTQ